MSKNYVLLFYMNKEKQMNINPIKNYCFSKPNYSFCKKQGNITDCNNVKTSTAHRAYPKMDVSALPYAKTPKKIESNNLYEFGQVILRGAVFNRHTTYCARGDLNWKELGKYLKDKFPHIEDVDIHCFGCSTGEEAYTLALLLKSLYKDEPFKILASDILDDIITNNKINQAKGIKLEKHSATNLLTYKLGIKTGVPDEFYDKINSGIYQIKPEITNSIDFSRKNILTSVNNISKTRPSIVLCRNMWPYIDQRLYYKFAQDLYDQLAPGSIVIIGNYDYCGEKKIIGSNSFPEAMRNSNFIPKKVALGSWCDNGDGNEDKVMIFER